MKNYYTQKVLILEKEPNLLTEDSTYILRTLYKKALSLLL
jgi:hypothetical protein